MKMWKVAVILMLLAVLVATCGTTSSGAPTVQPGVQPTTATTTQPGNQPTGVPAEVEIKIASFAFDPSSVTVKVGATVKWTNEDSASHTITADDGSWDSGSLGKGKSFSQVFTQAGTFTYHCTIHPSMKGTVVVTQ
jgi:plastocyanin